MKIKFIDKYGYPVQVFKGRWFVNFIRRLIHTRKIKVTKAAVNDQTNNIGE